MKKTFFKELSESSKHTSKQRRIRLWWQLNLIEDISHKGETFDSFVTDLKLLALGLDMTESDKLIQNAIACKSLDERVDQDG